MALLLYDLAGAEPDPFVGGGEPLYADYVVFGLFQWARCTSVLPLLATDDPLRFWCDRLLASFDGLARNAPGYNV